MKYILAIIAAFLLTVNFMKADEPYAYLIYDKDSDEEDFDEMLDEALDADIIFFGEIHNDPVVHWLQLQLTKKMHEETGEKLILGAEMFERDDQLLIDEYFAGKIGQKNFEKEAKLWNNYKTDYKPLVEFARENNLDFIATNIPRRYASLVNDERLEALQDLSPEAKKYLPPLPVEVDLDLPGYKKMEEMFHGHGGAKGESPHGSMEDMTDEQKAEMMKKMQAMMKKMDNFKAAQAIKDATMSHFILENYRPGMKFLHYNGTYHSNNFEGITWFVKRDRPSLKIMTIASVRQEDVEELEEENEGLADFIIVIPADMTETY